MATDAEYRKKFKMHPAKVMVEAGLSAEERDAILDYQNADTRLRSCLEGTAFAGQLIIAFTDS